MSQWILQAAAAPTDRPICIRRGRKDAGLGVHFLSPVLLQLTVLERSHEPAAICPECGCTFGVGRSTLRPHHASAAGAAVAFGSTSGGFQDGHPRYLSLSGIAAAYLAANCQLVPDEGRHKLRSVT